MSPRLSRRQLLASAATAAALAGCAADGGPDGNGSGSGGAGTTEVRTSATGGGTPPSVEVATEPLADGFTSPLGIVPLDADRLLVADQPGQVVLVDGGDTRIAADLRDRVVDVGGYTEQGLLGLAVHPASSDRLFVRYSAPPRGSTPDGYSHTFVLSEFAMDPGSGDVDPTSERTLLEIPEPQGNHNAGDLAFGPDGSLYVPVGDGGAGGDQGPGHVEDWAEAVGGGNGQDVAENRLGSLLRIDVDGRDGDRPYAIPDDNPLVGAEGFDEQFAWGLRNPWRLSFGPEGRCFVADVGQNEFEEVNVVERGGNYGWNVREGTACYGASECPTVTPDGEPLRDPVIEYGREGPVSGIAVIGGSIYRGSAIPALQGHFVFGDWRAEGRLFLASEADEGLWPTEMLSLAEDAVPLLLTIAEDTEGELLLGTSARSEVSGSTGAVHRVVAAE